MYARPLRYPEVGLELLSEGDLSQLRVVVLRSFQGPGPGSLVTGDEEKKCRSLDTGQQRLACAFF